MIVNSYSGGRLGNQLYYALQAYLHCITVLLDNCQLYQQLIDLNCKQFFCRQLESNDKFVKVNSYCQRQPSDYSINDLHNFIKDIILKSNKLHAHIVKNNNINTICIHIRNTDYLNIRASRYNRKKYLLDSLSSLAKKLNIFNILVVSDDINLCKNSYDELFHRFSQNVKYQKTNVIEDFLTIATHKNLILANSTFSYWAAHISNCLYGNYETIYCPSHFSGNDLGEVKARVHPDWNLIQTSVQPLLILNKHCILK